MNAELEVQEAIYNDISELLSKADSVERASGYLSTYLQSKIGTGVIDINYDYTIKDTGINGIQAIVEFCFTWNLTNMCSLLVLPKVSLATKFDRAMGVV